MCSISIVIPFRNIRHSVTPLLNDLRLQSCQEYELVFVDDGSTDNSRQFLEDVLGARANVKIHSIPHSGPSKARNVGARLASRPYLVFVDADDRLEFDFVEQYRDSINVAKPLLVQAGLTIVLKQKGETLSMLPEPAQISHPIKRPFLSGTYCVEAEFFWSVGGFTEVLRYSEHRELAIKLSQSPILRPGRIVTIEKTLYSYESANSHTEVYTGRRTGAAEYMLEAHSDRLAECGLLLTYHRIVVTGYAKLGRVGQFLRSSLRMVRFFPFSGRVYLTIAKGGGHLLNARLKAIASVGGGG